MSDVTLVGVTASGNQTGLNLSELRSFSSSNGDFSNNAVDGIHMTKIRGDMTIADMTARNNGDDGMDISDSRGAVILRSVRLHANGDFGFEARDLPTLSLEDITTTGAGAGGGLIDNVATVHYQTAATGGFFDTVDGLTVTASGLTLFRFSTGTQTTIRYFDVKALNVNTLSGQDTVDVFSVALGTATVIDAGPLNDTINARSVATGNVTLLGEAHNDRLYGGANEYLDGGAGDDSIHAGNGADTLIGGAGNDTLHGSSGNDRVDGGLGNDTLIGSTGDDTILGSAGVDRVVERFDASFALSQGTMTGVGTDLLSNIEEVSLAGGASDNLLNAIPFSGPVTLNGEGGNDTLLGGSGNDSLGGSTGDDRLLGNDGHDTLTGSRGNDTLDGGAGMDQVREVFDVSFSLANEGLTGLGDDLLIEINAARLTGGAGPNRINASAFTAGPVTLSGGRGPDLVTGGSQSDSLVGGAAIDHLVGGAGNDTLDGGPADDRLTGGTEDDLLIGSANEDVLNGELGDDTLDGGPGDDTLDGGPGIDLFQVIEPLDAGLFLTDTRVIGGVGSDVLRSIERAVITNQDTVPRGSKLDAAAFTAGPVTLIGAGGDDTLIGGSGADSLVAGDGNDRLEGNAGDDTLQGGNGVDIGIGGPGDDIAVEVENFAQ